MAHSTVRVGLEGRGYDIRIGPGLIAGAGAEIAPLIGKRAIIVSDETVAARYAQALGESLEKAGIAQALVTVAPGEASKSFPVFADLMERLLALKPDRKTAIIALGGGVIGDLAGFAASALLRGVPFIQIPTSLLAQVDSSVGGKTGINSSHGKNLIGAFYQPRLVLADTDVLETLPKRELLAGYAEIVKYGLLGDADFFAWLEVNGAGVIAGDAAARAEAIRRSCQAKAEIVAADEHETGVRALLNLGHTFGHALEKEAGYDGRLLHGEGVALGMLMAYALAEQRGMLSEPLLPRIGAHYRAVGLPLRPADLGLGHFDATMLTAYCRQDKKAEGGRLTFVLPTAIGQSEVVRDVEEADVRAVFTDALS